MRTATKRTTVRRALVAASTLSAFSLPLACADTVGPTDQTSATPSTALVAGTGTPHSFRSLLASDLCMDVTGSGTAPGTELVTWSCHGRRNQQFSWRSNGEIRVYDNMCVDASGARGRDGDPIIIWNCNGGANQKWSATAAGEIRGINGKCIDITGSNRTPGTPLVLWTCKGSANQRWDNGSTASTPTPTSPTSPAPTTPSQPSGSIMLEMSRQPSGMTLLADRAFSSRATSASDSRGAEGWSPDLEARSSYITIVRDATAPRDGTVWRLTYPSGKPDNPANSFSPVHAWMPLKSRPKVLYVSLWLKVSSDWLQHPGGETKLVQLMIANQPRMVLSLTGTGTGPITPVVRVNGGPDSRAGGYLRQNVSSRTFSRGSWHRFEAVLTANTPGVSNGGARWWLDGVELGNYTNVQWAGSGESASWSQLDFNPIWGGRNAQLSRTQYMWVEHLYASGK
jgi:hypothetical protein